VERLREANQSGNRGGGAASATGISSAPATRAIRVGAANTDFGLPSPTAEPLRTPVLPDAGTITTPKSRDGIRQVLGTFLLGVVLLVGGHLLHRVPETRADGWTEATQAVLTRHQDRGFRRQIRETPSPVARAQLAEVVELIKNNYYQPLDWRELTTRALMQMQAALYLPDLFPAAPTGRADPNGLRRIWARLEQDVRSAATWGAKDVLVLGEMLQTTATQAGRMRPWAILEFTYALADSLDEYSHLLSPEQYAALRDRLKGCYTGIGVDLLCEGTYPSIFDVIPDGPAARAGIRPGDLLLAVNGVTCRDRPGAFISSLLTGSPRDLLTLTIRRGAAERRVTLRREVLNSPSVRYVRLQPGPCPIGLLRIADFDYDTAMELRRQIDRLRREGARALVIDLRANGGGMFTAAVQAARLFLDKGTIVTVHTARRTTRYCAGGNGFESYRFPTVLLVDRYTASAAEIFAAALQDHGRAQLVGERTLGKALVQTVYGLQQGGMGLSLTTARYLPPSRRNFHKIGLVPDISAVRSSQAAPATGIRYDASETPPTPDVPLRISYTTPPTPSTVGSDPLINITSNPPVDAARLMDVEDPVVRRALHLLERKLSAEIMKHHASGA